jgi:hypothetical protein
MFTREDDVVAPQKQQLGPLHDSRTDRDDPEQRPLDAAPEETHPPSNRKIYSIRKK